MVIAGALYGYPGHVDVGLGHSPPMPLGLTVAPSGGISIGLAKGWPPGSGGSRSLRQSSDEAQTFSVQYSPNPTWRKSGFTICGRWNGPAIQDWIALVIRSSSENFCGAWNMTSLAGAALMPSGV